MVISYENSSKMVVRYIRPAKLGDPHPGFRAFEINFKSDTEAEWRSSTEGVTGTVSRINARKFTFTMSLCTINLQVWTKIMSPSHCRNILIF